MGCAKIKSICENYTRYHVSAFVLTFLSYSMLHAIRKSFSNVKTTMSAEWTPCFANESMESGLTPGSRWTHRRLFISSDDAEEFMGTLDASFMFAYAFGLFISGYIADRNDMRVVLCTGMVLTSVMVLVYGCVFEWLHVYSQPAYIGVWVLNGLLQSVGWPCVVAVMGNWFGKGSRGLVLGVWSSCASVGNILGSVLVSAVLDYGYDYAFLVTACVLLATAVLDLVGLVPTPLEVGLPLPHDDDSSYNMELEVIPEDKDRHDTKTLPNGHGKQNGTTQQNGVCNTSNKADKTPEKSATNCVQNGQTQESAMYDISLEESNDAHPKHTPTTCTSPVSDQDSQPQAVNFFTALLLPGVVPYALCYAFLKLVNYSFFFWLPFYLSNAYNMAETVADRLSIWYDLGGVVGGTVAGVISDRLQTRTVVVTPMLVIAVPMLFVYGMTGVAGSLLTNGVLLFVLGCLIGGVANLISAAISADLGRQKALRGNPKALSTVTGILDGTGSTGAALGQVAVPHLQVAFGWRTVFYLFMACTFLTAVCIARIFWQEAKVLIRRLRQK
ncbi:hypothetical protein ACOMHN_024663 [Nucella lapillus]